MPTTGLRTIATSLRSNSVMPSTDADIEITARHSNRDPVELDQIPQHHWQHTGGIRIANDHFHYALLSSPQARQQAYEYRFLHTCHVERRFRSVAVLLALSRFAQQKATADSTVRDQHYSVRIVWSAAGDVDHLANIRSCLHVDCLTFCKRVSLILSSSLILLCRCSLSGTSNKPAIRSRLKIPEE